MIIIIIIVVVAIAITCSTLVTLEAKNVIPITNYCTGIKKIKNAESNSVGIKSLLRSCDVQVEDKTGYKSYISIDEGLFRFFNDLEKISCDLISEGSYINCSDKEPETIKPKDQGFDKAPEKITDTTNMVNNLVVVSIAVAILVIFLYCYCNRTKVAIDTASVSSL
jgi:hypothetical protein